MSRDAPPSPPEARCHCNNIRTICAALVREARAVLL
jgi:hypothetical protein